MDEPPDSNEIALPTFAVLARFRATATSGQDAVRSVVARLTAAEEPFHEVAVERQEDDGSWMVVVRFVLASIDSHAAAFGLHKNLTAAGLTPDEVWADGRVS